MAGMVDEAICAERKRKHDYMETLASPLCVASMATDLGLDFDLRLLPPPQAPPSSAPIHTSSRQASEDITEDVVREQHHTWQQRLRSALADTEDVKSQEVLQGCVSEANDPKATLGAVRKLSQQEIDGLVSGARELVVDLLARVDTRVQSLAAGMAAPRRYKAAPCS